MDLGADVAAVDRNKDGPRCFQYTVATLKKYQKNRNINWIPPKIVENE